YRDKCQMPRSLAKQRPANNNILAMPVRLPLALSCVCTANAHPHNSGTASAMRQKADARGLVSDKRIKMPAKPMAKPPSNKERKATTGKVLLVIFSVQEDTHKLKNRNQWDGVKNKS
ncbi:MAG TPA: hypothetical protein VEF33_05105, partial [Syntrophales bacterium]|nr:hypothetical protein [Syntrophales bacterium]